MDSSIGGGSYMPQQQQASPDPTQKKPEGEGGQQVKKNDGANAADPALLALQTDSVLNAMMSEIASEYENTVNSASDSPDPEEPEEGTAAASDEKVAGLKSALQRVGKNELAQLKSGLPPNIQAALEMGSKDPAIQNLQQNIQATANYSALATLGLEAVPEMKAIDFSQITSVPSPGPVTGIDPAQQQMQLLSNQIDSAGKAAKIAGAEAAAVGTPDGDSLAAFLKSVGDAIADLQEFMGTLEGSSATSKFAKAQTSAVEDQSQLQEAAVSNRDSGGGGGLLGGLGSGGDMLGGLTNMIPGLSGLTGMIPGMGDGGGGTGADMLSGLLGGVTGGLGGGGGLGDMLSGVMGPFEGLPIIGDLTKSLSDPFSGLMGMVGSLGSTAMQVMLFPASMLLNMLGMGGILGGEGGGSGIPIIGDLMGGGGGGDLLGGLTGMIPGMGGEGGGGTGADMLSGVLGGVTGGLGGGGGGGDMLGGLTGMIPGMDGEGGGGTGADMLSGVLGGVTGGLGGGGGGGDMLGGLTGMIPGMDGEGGGGTGADMLSGVVGGVTGGLGGGGGGGDMLGGLTKMIPGMDGGGGTGADMLSGLVGGVTGGLGGGGGGGDMLGGLTGMIPGGDMLKGIAGTDIPVVGGAIKGLAAPFENLPLVGGMVSWAANNQVGALLGGGAIALLGPVCGPIAGVIGGGVMGMDGSGMDIPIVGDLFGSFGGGGSTSNVSGGASSGQSIAASHAQAAITKNLATDAGASESDAEMMANIQQLIAMLQKAMAAAQSGGSIDASTVPTGAIKDVLSKLQDDGFGSTPKTAAAGEAFNSAVSKSKSGDIEGMVLDLSQALNNVGVDTKAYADASNQIGAELGMKSTGSAELNNALSGFMAA